MRIKPIAISVAGIALSLVQLNLACAGPSVSLGLRTSRWAVNDSTGESNAVDGRINLSGRIALQFQYDKLDPNAMSVPAEGYATLPDVSGEMIITPLPNRFFAPFVSLGGGIARYADDRVSLTAGVGTEVTLQRWLVLFAHWRVVGPGPLAVASAVQQRRAETPPQDQQPIGTMLKEHYNLRTTELTFGYRLTY